jgi:hypothetical protein
MEDLGLDGRIIFRCILQEQVGSVCVAQGRDKCWALEHGNEL